MAASAASMMTSGTVAQTTAPTGGVHVVALDRTAVLNSARTLARWQLDQLGRTKFQPLVPTGPEPDPVALQFFNSERAENPTSWHQATFWLGMSALADHGSDPWINDAILAHGRAQNWKLGDRLYNADDHPLAGCRC